MTEHLPKMTEARESFVKELITGDFSRTLPQLYRDQGSFARAELNELVGGTGQKLTSYTLTLGADGATAAVRGGLLGAIQTLALHVAMTRRCEGATEDEARALTEQWFADFKADADRIVRFLWSGEVADMPLAPDSMTTAEVANAAEAAKDRLAHSAANYFMSLVSAAERFCVVFREKGFAVEARKKFAMLIDGGRREAAGKVDEAMGARSEAVH